MLKKDIVKTVAEKTGNNQNLITPIVDEVFSSMREAMTLGEKIYIKDFAVLKPVVRAPRVARNPQTGETIQVPSKKSYKFEICDSLKEAMNS